MIFSPLNTVPAVERTWVLPLNLSSATAVMLLKVIMPPRTLPLRVVELVRKGRAGSVRAAVAVVVALPISSPGMRSVPTLVCFVLFAVVAADRLKARRFQGGIRLPSRPRAGRRPRITPLVRPKKLCE